MCYRVELGYKASRTEAHNNWSFHSETRGTTVITTVDINRLKSPEELQAFEVMQHNYNNKSKHCVNSQCFPAVDIPIIDVVLCFFSECVARLFR
jgi:hypothetical protein